MAWQSLTSADVLSKLSGAELSALQTAALGDGQSDPVPGIIQAVVDEVRGYVAANHDNQLGAAGTIPSKLVSAALAIIRHRLCTRLPVASLLTEQRIREKDDAIRLTPPRAITLEYAITYIQDDELVEITPQNIRLRKKGLTEHDRKRLRRLVEAQG